MLSTASASQAPDGELKGELSLSRVVLCLASKVMHVRYGKSRVYGEAHRGKPRLCEHLRPSSRSCLGCMSYLLGALLGCGGVWENPFNCLEVQG